MKQYHTKQREVLLQYLTENAERPQSVEEITEALCARHKVSVSAVYRNLGLLAADDDVRKFISEDGRTTLYQYVNRETCDAHLHLKCTVCGRLIHMEDGASDQVLRAVTRSSDFSVDEKKTVLFGVCSGCKGNACGRE